MALRDLSLSDWAHMGDEMARHQCEAIVRALPFDVTFIRLEAHAYCGREHRIARFRLGDGEEAAEFVLVPGGEVSLGFRRRSETVRYPGSCGPAQQGRPTPAFDPGCVKTPKGRVLRGIVCSCNRRFATFPRTVVASFASLTMKILLPSSALAFLHGQEPQPTWHTSARCDAATAVCHPSGGP
jgi:hypothetical protein